MNPIEALGEATVASRLPALAGGVSNMAAGPDFLATISQGLDALQQDTRHAGDVLAALATDPGVATHDVILAMEQARLSLQLAVEVRQRVIDAYKEITSMQI